jgi:hypothetical protein
MPHYRTACTQVYNYHRLLAWEPEKGLHVDVFKVSVGGRNAGLRYEQPLI